MFIIEYSIPVDVEFYRNKYSNKIKCSHFNCFQSQIKKKNSSVQSNSQRSEKNKVSRNYCVNRSSSERQSSFPCNASNSAYYKPVGFIS